MRKRERVRDKIKRIRDKKRETEGEIAWKRKNLGRQERSSDRQLRETEGVIKYHGQIF